MKIALIDFPDTGSVRIERKDGSIWIISKWDMKNATFLYIGKCLTKESNFIVTETADRRQYEYPDVVKYEHRPSIRLSIVFNEALLEEGKKIPGLNI